MPRLAVLAGVLVSAAGLQLPAAAAGAAAAVPACDGWQVVAGPAPASSALTAVAATSRRNAWAVGHVLDPAHDTSAPLTEHWDGSAWSVVPFPEIPGAVSEVTSLLGVTALSRANAWTVGLYSAGAGLRTLIGHWNGTRWKIIPSPNRGSGGNLLEAVAARTATDVWAAG